MSRARQATRRTRDGAINKGVGHGIKKLKKRPGGKHTKIKPFVESPPSPKVKPADRVPIVTSPASSESPATDAASNRFFRSRDLNRKATVSMTKGLKLQLTSGGALVRSPAPTRLGPYKNLAPTRPKAAAEPRDLLTAIDEMAAAAPPAPGTPSAGPVDSEGEWTPRRSPRKHQRPPAGPEPASPPAGATPRSHPQEGQQAEVTPLRRSPRKQCRPLPVAVGTPTHAENAGPTRLTLTPRRSPRKHQQPTPQRAQSQSTPQSASSGTQRTPAAVYDRLEEQLMKMEAGEDKENESPQRKHKDADAKFYSIFYRKTNGTVEQRGETPKTKAAPAAGIAKSLRSAGRPSADGKEQLVIDAGQRQFGVLTCPTCTLVYTLGDPEDEALHAKHHTGYLSALNYPGWKREHEVGHYMDGRVLVVGPRDPPYAWKKVDSVLGIVDAELGFVGVGVRNKAQSKVFFYVVERQIVGCLVAEPVNRGFPVLPRDDSAGGRGVRCDTRSRPCRVGVSRVWVQRDFRRRQIASRMVEAMRNHFDMTPLLWHEVAFSDPTPDGLEFAAGVTGSQEFLVYNQ